MASTINRNLVFIDSIQFMNSSLDEFVKNLSDNDFKYLSQEFGGELLELVKKKGVYPYKYMNSFKRFFYDRVKFYSSLKKKCVSDKDHLDAANVCNIFEMETMGDYHNLYLKKDVLLLVDVFEKFTGACLVYY